MQSNVTLQQYLQVLKIKQYHRQEAVLLLKNIVAYIRPSNKKNKDEVIANFETLANALAEDNKVETAFYNLIANVIIDSNITDLLTDSGIVTGATFAQQAKRIINEKFIPPYQEPDDMNTYLLQVFYKKWDWQWIALIPNESLQAIINNINDVLKLKTNDLAIELQNAAKVISYRIASLGLDKEILIRANKKENLITAFTEQNIELIRFLHLDDFDLEKENQLNTIRASLIQCNQNIIQLERNSIETGTSINQTFLLRRLHQNVERLKMIITLLLKNKAINTNNISYFIKEAIHFLQTKNDFSKFASNNLNLLAFRIVDHTKDTGESYITSTRSEYWKMFAAACGGGFIVSILVMFKFKIGTLHLPLFWEGFLYTLNYAIGFIAIQLSGFTLATKQPAMTASTIANLLKGSDKKDFAQMSVLISKVSRTQFISIVGNVFIVMPFIVGWLFLFQQITGLSYLSVAAAESQLKSNHPLLSLSLLFAAIAGVFLFISGLVSGYVENRMVYAKIPERMQQHSFLQKILPKKWFLKLIQLLKLRSGAIFGNATLGLLLGMSSFFGKIFGLPIDIRHVTFAAGNIAMGVLGGGLHNINYLFACLGGIALIGLINVFVSFSLAFYLALKARNLHFSDYPELTRTLWKHFWSNPLEFFLPRRGGRSSFLEKQQETTLYTNDLGIK